KNAMSKTQKVVMDSKKSEMKEKVESGEIPAQQAQKMKEKMGNQSVDVKQAKLKTIVSQGSNLQASNIVTNVLSGVGQNLNKQITKQSLS
ncbi:phage infection protein, partial [Staphylococcus aureus]|nr:phage infection protein [Staphylococcus aureus]